MSRVNVIWLAACRSTELAAEVRPSKRIRDYGALTDAMLDAMEQHGENMTNREALKAIYDKLQDEGIIQHPELCSSRPLDMNAPFWPRVP